MSVGVGVGGSVGVLVHVGLGVMGVGVGEGPFVGVIVGRAPGFFGKERASGGLAAT